MEKKTNSERVHFCATHSIIETLNSLKTVLAGLTQEGVEKSRNLNGINKVTKEKKKSVVKRVLEAFINPFTAILLCLSLIHI